LSILILGLKHRDQEAGVKPWVTLGEPTIHRNVASNTVTGLLPRSRKSRLRNKGKRDRTAANVDLGNRPSAVESAPIRTSVVAVESSADTNRRSASVVSSSYMASSGRPSWPRLFLTARYLRNGAWRRLSRPKITSIVVLRSRIFPEM